MSANELSQEELDHIIGACVKATALAESAEREFHEAAAVFEGLDDMRMVWLERAAKRFGIPLVRYFDDEKRQIYLCWAMIDTGEVVFDDDGSPMKPVRSIEDLLALRLGPEQLEKMNGKEPESAA